MKIEPTFENLIWSSNVPAISSVIDVFGINTILEIGSGRFSTPLMASSNAKNVFSIENNAEWIETVKQQVNTDRVCFINHDIGDIHPFTKYDELKTDEVSNIINYYKTVYEQLPINSPSLLFVDGYRATRVLAANTIGMNFDIVCIHDFEDKALPYYDYEALPILHGKIPYVLKFNYTSIPWTGCFIDQKHQDRLEELRISMSNEVVKWWESIGCSQGQQYDWLGTHPVSGELVLDERIKQ